MTQNADTYRSVVGSKYLSHIDDMRESGIRQNQTNLSTEIGPDLPHELTKTAHDLYKALIELDHADLELELLEESLKTESAGFFVEVETRYKEKTVEYKKNMVILKTQEIREKLVQLRSIRRQKSAHVEALRTKKELLQSYVKYHVQQLDLASQNRR